MVWRNVPQYGEAIEATDWSALGRLVRGRTLAAIARAFGPGAFELETHSKCAMPQPVAGGDPERRGLA
ncbi:MAG TPA: hypothetical protein PKK06_15375 [Phycisphaerae bacterium]|nr:hypothetical protein [Phycisphaerae bacterium]HNU46728.1 hypothetical protein [Phycisphaerae bacterium]